MSREQLKLRMARATLRERDTADDIATSNWADALRTLEAQLVCPCGAKNSLTLRPIAIDVKGNAACDCCRRARPVQEFMPEHVKERT